MPDDRDRLRTKTPPAGVRAQTAQPIREFDADDLITKMTKRTERADASSRAAFGAIGELRRELRHAVQRDMEDHKSMSSSIERVADEQRMMNEHVGDLRQKMGVVEGELKGNTRLLTLLTEQLEDERRARNESARLRAVVEVEERKVELEVKKTTAIAAVEIDKTAKVAAIEDTTDEKKHKRKRAMKLFGIISGLLTILGALATQC